MRSTGRPRSPPLALTSSPQIWSASSALLPPPKNPPVNDIDRPILIGSAAAAGRPSPNVAHSIKVHAMAVQNDFKDFNFRALIVASSHSLVRLHQPRGFPG